MSPVIEVEIQAKPPTVRHNAVSVHSTAHAYAGMPKTSLLERADMLKPAHLLQASHVHDLCVTVTARQRCRTR